ncbi:MAG: 6,7-dimethyl-8-ribityllumazine synthase [Prosthecobacter sp.]|nr:6,7-dimethyl-8-ribityllumazine synthase [Prosthecobacter sp.]
MSTAAPSRPRPIQDRISIAIVASLFNDAYVQGLLDAGRDELSELAPNATITVFRVPGAFEIPVCAELALKSTRPDAVVAFGVIIRGETEHGDLIAASVTDALQSMAVRYCTPVVNQVLLVENEEQAEARCFGAALNRGTEAARVAVNMIALFKKMRASFAGQPEREDA